MDKYLILYIILITAFLGVRAQQLTLETDLDASINESSGLLYLNNTLITHNDTDGTNQLYEVDVNTGAITRTITITNGINGDWEDLAHDDTYIYIGDFGNYEGQRTDLKVYRISINDYFANTSVTADVINFSYSDQTDFTPSPLMTNYDAEGLIHHDNKLYVFSKNWVDGNTDIYELSKTPGTYSISATDTIAVQGLISGATFNALNNHIVLTGYDTNGAFLVELDGFHSGQFSNGTVTKTSVGVPTNYSPQIEGIAPIDDNAYYISAEENTSVASGLYSFNMSTLGISENEQIDFIFYPNPAKVSITLNQDHCSTAIYTITGQLIKTSKDKQIDISELDSGLYLITIAKTSTGNSVTKRLIIDKGN
ncbi:T9SS type A sorting domain-containing protein [Winogradskyella flava]|uniref:T9SS type A sorting domain-containing protein n=1 Tax=Winogradskyella flava TaxID=1884876 RepID=A0A842ITU0_9FLAO|nr:T9SS type A sorting domain-containing protein [Winogradskyella flava]MBC2845294.1 T9SS type A sorting domain-containing protein [Winogradskyella flava]